MIPNGLPPGLSTHYSANMKVKVEAKMFRGCVTVAIIVIEDSHSQSVTPRHRATRAYTAPQAASLALPSSCQGSPNRISVDLLEP